MRPYRIKPKREQCELDIYMQEYKIVVDKITSLSLKFSGGSYIIPISLVVGVLSIGFDHLYLNLVSIIFPLVLALYMYNHVRYMALQFKLSGYARHLEEKINALSNSRALLWENSLARSNSQGLYEGVFLGAVYVFAFLLVFTTSYRSLSSCIYSGQIDYAVGLLIAITYYFSTILVLGFLLFYTNAHMKLYKLSNSLDPKSLSSLNEGRRRFAGRTGCVNKYRRGSARIKRTKRMNKHDMRPIIVILLFVLFVALLPLSVMPMIYSFSTETAPLDQYDTVVVLGNRSVNNVPSSDMRDRLDCLISNMDSFTDATIIFSGGNGEASLMEDYMSGKGYDDNDYILETESGNTYENLQNIRRLVSGKTLIITSDYHAFRTDYLSHTLDIDVDILSAPSTTPTILKAARECYAFLFEMLSGRDQSISAA